MNKSKILVKVHELCGDDTCKGTYPCDKFMEISNAIDQLIDSVPEPVRRILDEDFTKGWNGMCNNNHNWKIEARK